MHTIVAVLDDRLARPNNSQIIFLDLRGVGAWPQWVIVQNHYFHLGEYLEELQIEVVDGFSVVYGGRPEGRDGGIHVECGDLVEVVLRPRLKTVEIRRTTMERLRMAVTVESRMIRCQVRRTSLLTRRQVRDPGGRLCQDRFMSGVAPRQDDHTQQRLHSRSMCQSRLMTSHGIRSPYTCDPVGMEWLSETMAAKLAWPRRQWPAPQAGHQGRAQKRH